MAELMETAVAGANLGVTVLLGLMLLYWLAVLIGVVGLDLFDFDLDVGTDVGDLGDVGGDLDVGADADVEVGHGGASSMLSIGAVILKGMNIGRVPLMLWLSIFALSLWVITMIWDNPQTHESVGRELAILLRNGFLAVLATKLLTQPIRGQFEDIETPGAKDYVGHVCVVTTSEVTDRFGQVRCETGASPLLLNARTRQTAEPLKKGDSAVIVGYQQGIYFVEKEQQEDQT